VIGFDLLLSGGDDYEVLCTIPEQRLQAFAAEAKQAGVVVTAIGTVMAGTAAPRFIDAQGRQIALQRLSYSHF